MPSTASLVTADESSSPLTASDTGFASAGLSAGFCAALTAGFCSSCFGSAVLSTAASAFGALGLVSALALCCIVASLATGVACASLCSAVFTALSSFFTRTLRRLSRRFLRSATSRFFCAWFSCCSPSCFSCLGFCCSSRGCCALRGLRPLLLRLSS